MRTIVLFVIVIACTAFMGCSDVRHLAKEGLIPAAEKSVKKATVTSGANVTIQQNNLSDVLGKRKITFSGMTPKQTFIFVQFDNSRQERKVGKDGTVSFLTPKNRKVKVTYVYGDYGLSKTFTLDQTKNYRWNASTQTFNVQ